MRRSLTKIPAHGATSAEPETRQVTSAAFHGASCPLAGSANANLPSGCVKFGYDSKGRVSTQIYPGNVTSNPIWDASNRITAIRATRAGTKPVTLLDQSYKYAAKGANAAGTTDRVSVQSMIDNTGDFVPAGATTTYGYDSQRRLTSAVGTSGGATNASWSYAYDKDGNRTSQTITGNAGSATTGTRTFAYNGADELTSINGSTTGISYDANGDEIASPGWLAGGVAGRSNVQTANNGDVAQWTRPDSGDVFNFTNEQVLPTGTRNLTWAHDVTYTWTPTGLASYTSPNSLGQVKLFTLPGGQTLGYQVNGKMEYFHKDRLGSILALSTDTGDKDAYYRYDPYGQPRSYPRNSNEAKANILMYTGLPRDYSTGLIRMGARWYDPTLGRFTQADPSGQETNPYLYAAGNPVNSVDPTGLRFSFGFQSAMGLTMTAAAGVTLKLLAPESMVVGAAVGAAIGFYGGVATEVFDPTATRGSVLKSGIHGAIGGAIGGALA